MKNLSPKPKPPNKDNKSAWFDYARYSSLAIQMFFIIAVGIVGGAKLDKWLELKIPVFTLTLALLSVAAAIYIAVKDLLKNK